jgi:RNA polymerase sigma-70 factor (sigma-E family)
VDTREEFDEYVRARHDRLCRVAFLVCGDWQHAQDLVQNALAKTYVVYRRGRIENLDAYVHRAVATAGATWWRRRWHGELAIGSLPETAGADDYDRADTRGAVLAALATLPRTQRAVLALRYLADLSEADTALALGCSPGTVKSSASRALATLRESGLLTDEGARNHG